MVSVAAHDIRSPLAALGGAASTLLKHWRDTTDEQREELFQAMGNDAARMNRILREVVDAGRIIEGKLEPALERVDFAALVERIGTERGSDVDQAPVEVDADPTSALVDPQRTATALEAMVRAAEWWGREGPVRISLRSRTTGISVTVARSAPDLGRDRPDELFVAGRGGAGAGARLGLFVARGVAEAHGGSLTVRVDTDIELTLTLPISA
jgi:K+-sensing histidine kinase KdpD